MIISEQKKTIVWLLVLSLVGFGIYFHGVKIQYYADDFQWVFDSPSSKVFYYFFHKNAFVGFYRPIQTSFNAVIQAYFGLDTLPIHITQISMHILFSWFILFVMLRLGFSGLQAILGSLFMLVSQANTMAVLSNDTLSQIAGTIFGCVSLWFLYRFSFNGGSKNNVTKFDRYKYYLLSILMFMASLLSKESSVSFFPLVLGIIILKEWKINGQIYSIKRTIIESFPYCILTVLYFIVRLFIVEGQPAFGSERYDFQIGINIIKNLTFSLFAVSIPTSSVTVFTSFTSGALLIFSTIVIISLIFSAWVGYGLWCSNRLDIISVLGIFAITSLFPMVMMNRISELYVYNAMPFISILVGVGLGKHFELSKTSWVRQGIAAGVVGLLLASHVAAIQSKALLMKGNGERAAILLNHIGPYIESVPKSGYLLLLNPPSSQIEYSVFLMRGFNVLNHGLHRIGQMSGRNDYVTKIVELSDLEEFRTRYDLLILSIYGDSVRVYKER